MATLYDSISGRTLVEGHHYDQYGGAAVIDRFGNHPSEDGGRCVERYVIDYVIDKDGRKVGHIEEVYVVDEHGNRVVEIERIDPEGYVIDKQGACVGYIYEREVERKPTGVNRSKEYTCVYQNYHGGYGNGFGYVDDHGHHFDQYGKPTGYAF